MPKRLLSFSRLFLKTSVRAGQGSEPTLLSCDAGTRELSATASAPGRACQPPRPTHRPARRHAYGWPADWARAARCPPTRCWGRRTRWSSARSRRPPAWPPAAASIRAAGALTSGGWILQRWQRKLSLNLLKRTQNKQTNKKKTRNSVDSKVENTRGVSTNLAPS